MKKKSLSRVKKKAWSVFSEYIRKKYATEDGFVDCITCQVVLPWKSIQAGHFVPGRRNAVLFDERGVHPQCYRCNCLLNGNLIEYFPFMEKKYGKEVIEDLKSRNRQTKIYTIEDLEDMILLWKTAIKDTGIL